MAIELIKLKKGIVYRASFCKHGKRIRKCFDRKWDAQKWVEQQEQLHRFGFHQKISFSKAANLWLENHSKVRKSPSAYSCDQRMVRSFEPEFGKFDLENITPEMIEGYISKRVSNQVKPSTINRNLQCIRAILNYFIKKRYLTVNVVSLVGLLSEDGSQCDYLSFEDADRFLSYANQKYAHQNRWVYRFYLLALNTGLRWGEITALKWDKVDFYQKLIIVARSYCKVSKKIRETTKGRKIRYVGINSLLLPELKAQMEEVSNGSNPLNLVFPYLQKVVNVDNFKRDRFEKDLKKAEIRQIRFHDLRHTFASHFMMKGGNLYDLQKLLGHSDISTTERYAHLSIESVVSKNELVAMNGEKKEITQLQDYRARKAS